MTDPSVYLHRMAHPARAETPEKKREIVERLLRVWGRYPQLRLGQLIVARAPGVVPNPDLFYVEDEGLLTRMESEEAPTRSSSSAPMISYEEAVEWAAPFHDGLDPLKVSLELRVVSAAVIYGKTTMAVGRDVVRFRIEHPEKMVPALRYMQYEDEDDVDDERAVREHQAARGLVGEGD